MNELPQIYTSTGMGQTYACSNAGLFSTATDTLAFKPFISALQQTPIKQEENADMSNRRIVQVYIADPNENVPLEKSLLFQDEKPHLTDLTDQELFFEIDIKNILEKHNEYRVTVKDKESSEGKNNDVLLEKAKIRDLKMTVVVIAQF